MNATTNNESTGSIGGIFAITGLLFVVAIWSIIQGSAAFGLVLFVYANIYFIVKCLGLEGGPGFGGAVTIDHIDTKKYLPKAEKARREKVRLYNERKARERQARANAKANMIVVSEITFKELQNAQRKNAISSLATAASGAAIATAYYGSTTVADDNFGENSGFGNGQSEPDEQVEINPANGLPMVSGIGGVDVEGNAYGTDNDSTAVIDLAENTTFSIDDSFSGTDDCFSTMDDSWSSSDGF